MESLAMIFMIFMFFFGIAHVISAIILFFALKNKWAKRNYGYYLLGVVAYFLILALFGAMQGYGGPDALAVIYFFVGAWGLAAYHTYILIAKKNHPNVDESDPYKQEPPVMSTPNTETKELEFD